MREFLEKYKGAIYQFARFLGIGFLNAAMDFGVFNIMIAATGVTEGAGASFTKIVSFAVAVVHSFYWNKYWAFQAKQDNFLSLTAKSAVSGLLGIGVIASVIYGASQKFAFGYFLVVLLGMFLAEVALWFWFGLNRASQSAKLSPAEFSMFASVSVIGAGLGAGIVWFVTSLIDPIFGFNERLWANLANVVASGVVLCWNFAGYKLFVFKK